MKRINISGKLFAVCAAVMLSLTLLATGTYAASEKVIKEVEARHIINGLNGYNGAAQGTYTKLSSYDGISNVLELHTADGAGRVLSGDSYPKVANFTDAPIKPGMKLVVTYKYVPDRTVEDSDTPTDLTALLAKKPQMISTSPSINGGSGAIDAVENIVADEWATATFRLGDYISLDNTVYYSRGRFFLLSICGSGAATGTKLAIEGGTAIHVDPKDALYVSRVKLVQECYDITLSLDGGSLDGSTDDAVITFEGTALTPPTPEKDGYVFTGWSATKGGEALDLTAYIPNGDTTLYALYKEEEKVITVDFDLNGGNIGGKTSVDGVVYNEGVEIAYPEDPVKQYRFFKGWTTVKDDKSALIDRASWKPSDSIILYAYYNNEKVIADKNSGALIKGLNKYNGAAQGTYASGKTVDGRNGVLELHTLNTAQRVLSGDVYNTNTTFSDVPVKPGMRLEIDYKYIPDTTVAEADTPTDVAAITALKPRMKMSSPSAGQFDAQENIKANEWTTAVFRIGDHVSASNDIPLTRANIFMLSLSGSGAPTGTSLALENGTAIHVDPQDTLYIGNSRLIQECYLVSFDLAGGNVDGETTVDPYFYEGEGIEFPTPEREGYKFIGWGYNATDFAGIDTSSFVPASDITLHALWLEGHIGLQAQASGRVFVKGVVSDSSKVASGTRTELVIDGYDAVELSVNPDTKAALTPDCYSFEQSFSDNTLTTRTRFVVTYKYVPAQDTETEIDKVLASMPTIRFSTTKGWTNFIEATSAVVRDTWATAVFELDDATINGEKLAVGEKLTTTQAQLRILGSVSGAASGTALDFGGGTAIHMDENDKIYIGEGRLMYIYDYEISFDANGGGGGDASEHIMTEFGGAKFDGMKPVRIGYDFIGWAESATATEADILGAGYMPTGDVTLYAVWKKNDEYTFGEFAAAYPQSGSRDVAGAGKKLYTDADDVMSENLPVYLENVEYSLDAKAEKSVLVMTHGWVYVMTPNGEGSDAENLTELGFVKVGEVSPGELSATVTDTYDIYGKSFASAETIKLGAHTIVFGNIVLPDDSLNVPEIIMDPAEKLDEHPEYAEFLEGARKFGGCPSITQTPDGTLWLSVTSGGVGEDINNYAALKKSTDGGLTWSEFVLVADPDAPVRTSEPFVWCDPQGRLYFWWSQMFMVPSKGNSDGRMGVFMMWSDDYGKTWTKPERKMHGFSNQNPIILSNGNMAMPVNIWNNNSNHPELDALKKPALYISSDRGETWTLAGAATQCSDSWFWENSIMEKKDGTLEMYYRTVSAGVEKTVSEDGGKSWSAGTSAGISKTSARTATVKLKNGNWVIVSHDDEYANGARSHMTVWLSEDEGETMPYKIQIDTVGWYPAIYEGNDGFLYIVYDRGREGGGCAMFAKLTEADIKAGRLVSEGSCLKYLTFRGTISNEVLTTDLQATVNFDTDGGEEIAPMPFRTNHNEFTVPVTVRTLPTAKKDNYRFLGWANEKGGEVAYAALAEYTPSALGDVTLYAVYEKDENAKYEVNVSISGIAREEGKKPNPESLARLTFMQNGETVATVIENADNTSSAITASLELAKGEYDVKIEKNGYVAVNVKATVHENGITFEDFTLVPGDVKGDFDDFCGDGIVDIDDFIRVLRGFDRDASELLRKSVDINEDGIVNVGDIALVKKSFGKTSDTE